MIAERRHVGLAAVLGSAAFAASDAVGARRWPGGAGDGWDGDGGKLVNNDDSARFPEMSDRRGCKLPIYHRPGRPRFTQLLRYGRVDQ